MTDKRLKEHPILPIPSLQKISFTWNGSTMWALPDEMISSALLANGVKIFGKHKKDGSPQGIFCANGQCSQCMVLLNDFPVKACMTKISAGDEVAELRGDPIFPKKSNAPYSKEIKRIELPALILGGGPAGLSAGIELGKMGIKSLLIDDKPSLGGKLLLQTHRFFGSISTVHAGTRGIEIAKKLESEIKKHPSIEIWTNSTALGIFRDRVVGILKEGKEYVILKPQVTLVATGARERSIVFRGNTLPGVIGAGAFQTLVNRDLVKISDRLFIIGGGNVGLIAGYHALQAGIEVVGLAEAMPECGGYKVHKDKLIRAGVPIYTNHTIISANGRTEVESVTISEVNELFRPVEGSERSFKCDTILVAVGLDPVNEFAIKAKKFGMHVLSAGDAEEIAEASAAMFAGKIRGVEMAKMLGADAPDVPENWVKTAEILKSRPGRTENKKNQNCEDGIVPVFHCYQEIPCNPCSSVCPQHLIKIEEADIRHLPVFLGGKSGKKCVGCEKCVTICPGLAVTLVDYRNDPQNPTVTIAHEFSNRATREGDSVTAISSEGEPLGDVTVTNVRTIEKNDHTILLKLQAPKNIAARIAGIRVQELWVSEAMEEKITRITDDTIVCRCERITAGTIRELIRKGYRDVNEVKAVTRAGMGACQGKTCQPLIKRLFSEEGVPFTDVTENTRRPLFIEVPIGIFAGVSEEK